VNVDRDQGLTTSIEQATANGGADTLQLNLDAGNDIAYVKSTLAGLVTTINGGADDDQVHVGSQANTHTGSLNSIAGKLVVNGDTGNADALYLYDQTDSAANTGDLIPTQITGLGMGTLGISYAGLESLNINLGSGGNTFTIEDTHAGSTVLNSG